MTPGLEFVLQNQNSTDLSLAQGGRESETFEGCLRHTPELQRLIDSLPDPLLPITCPFCGKTVDHRCEVRR